MHDVRHIVHEFESRTLDGSKAQISGYASIFNKASQVLGGGFVEKIQKGAFGKTLQERGTQTSRDDIKALFNHSTDLVLGSKRAGTLRLSEDSKGLHYEVDLDLDITHHRSAFKMIERGDVTNSSFGFDVIEERWSVPENSDDPVLREVLETRLYEVSPTPFPAYQDSTVSAERSFKGLADMSGLDLRDLIEANEKGSLKDLLVEENESVFNADARQRRLDLSKEVTSEARQRYLYLIRQTKDDKEQSTPVQKDQIEGSRRILKDQLVVIVIKTLSFLNKQKSLFKIVLINIMKKLRKRDWQLGGE